MCRLRGFKSSKSYICKEVIEEDIDKVIEVIKEVKLKEDWQDKEDIEEVIDEVIEVIKKVKSWKIEVIEKIIENITE